ncbi:MAG: molybdopterin-dependent oxidoreductase [Anaerolineaceae bacterium]|nr:molybdopterin-dependent oxidoreductase [Anaerolineaceae bacterium]
MTLDTKTITLNINDQEMKVNASPRARLLDVLRDLNFMSVKQGCGTGDCGVCTVLLDGKPVRSCMTKVEQAAGHAITTLEGIQQGGALHPLQQAFIETGAIQCGFCTPAQLLTAKAFLDQNPNPGETEIREALSGVLCRCTAYVRVVEGVQRAAAVMRGESVPPVDHIAKIMPEDANQIDLPEAFRRPDGGTNPLPPLVYTPQEMTGMRVVGKPIVKFDAAKLAKGRPVFAGDLKFPDMLHGVLMTSPHAHARIKSIDASKAEALPGVHAVLTYENVKRVKHSSGGQSPPKPLPYDQVVLDDKLRFAGDRVAVVAAESVEIANEAIRLIEVEYEVLPVVVDAEKAMLDGAPVIHDEEDTEGIYDAAHNIVHHIEKEIGDVDGAFAAADHVFEGTYRTPKQQHAHLEPHVCLTWWDEDDRLVIRSSTQVPFHIRRMVAPLIGLPVQRIRVYKPRLGGGFGNKQEMTLEDMCSLLTLRTGRPVLMEYTRKQEFTSSRSRHPNVIRCRIAVKDGKVTATDIYTIGDTGAHGTQGLTVQMAGGLRGLTLYNSPNARYVTDVVYTNKPPSAAFRGYGAMQVQFGVEVLMEEAAEALGVDVVDFKRANWIRKGDPMRMAVALGEGREGFAQTLDSGDYGQLLDIGIKATNFEAKHTQYRQQTGSIRKGIGFSVTMHGSGVAGLDMAAATIKLNDGGFFNLAMGAVDCGTGSDTILAQIAGEVLGVPAEDFVVYSSDTDHTPFDKGAYASSTTYISGNAVRKTAMRVADQVREHAAAMLGLDDPASLVLQDRKVIAPDGQSVTMAEVAMSSLHQMNQHQIIASESHMSYQCPPPLAAQFAEVEVNTETGQVTVERLLMVADCGRVINPITAAGQVEGGMSQAWGFALCEDMVYDESGRQVNTRLGPYHIMKSNEAPSLDAIFVENDEPHGPLGAKSVGELVTDGGAPAIVSAIYNATGVWARDLPCYPEYLWRMLQNK